VRMVRKIRLRPSTFDTALAWGLRRTVMRDSAVSFVSRQVRSGKLKLAGSSATGLARTIQARYRSRRPTGSKLADQ
jgi:hypothetical protein